MWDSSELGLQIADDAGAIAIGGPARLSDGSALAERYHVIPHGTDVSEAPESFDAIGFIERTVREYAGRSIDGVMASDDYPGSIVASVVARELGLRAPAPSTLLRCQHKYYSRLAQRTVVPEAVPRFALVDPGDIECAAESLAYPVFVKPVKSFFSVLAQPVRDADELRRLARDAGWHLREFVRPFDQLVRRYSELPLGGGYLIAEQPLTGVQVTVEGCVSGGEVSVIGITDSIMYPGTISFQRFEYPSALPACVQRRMEELATRLIGASGFDHGLFNIEMMYDPATGSIHLIEVNPRMCPQFADLMEKVNGVNTYEIALSIASGVRPVIRSGEARDRIAASFVFRVFEDALVRRIPSRDELAAFHERFPDARVKVLCREGHRLSEELQDGKSFRYAVLNLGAATREELVRRYEEARAALNFVLERAG